MRSNHLSDKSASILSQLIQVSPLEYLDISENEIVLRHLDSLLVATAFKFNLEFFGIEGNKKAFVNKSNSVCSCLWNRLIKNYTENSRGGITFMNVTPL